MTRVFSGIQPTGGGVPHLGNYLGALRGYVALQDGHEATYCVVDQHATTVAYDFRNLGRACLTTAAALIACGVDPARAVLFRQSAVPGHSMLAQVLGHIASLGPLERMTQFKEKGRITQGDQRDSIGLGLLTYPVLMAADILVHRAELVPVGEDQHQHLQFATMLAKRFNSTFKVDYFALPRKVFQDGAARIMSLRNPTQKMSKSDPDQSGVIYLTDTIEQAAKKFRSAVTEGSDATIPSDPDGLVGRPALENLIGMLAALRGSSVADICHELGGKGFKPLKDALTEAHNDLVVPIGRRMAELATPEGEAIVRSALRDGAARADATAHGTIEDVYRIVGFAD